MSKVSKQTNKPVQALLNAVTTSKLRLVRLLIEGGVHVDSRNDRGQTPLLITCSLLNNTCHARGETRERVVKYLISAGADVNTYDVTGRTPLIYAVITRASVIFDLVDAGADPWREDDSRKCAFDYALQNRDIVQVGLMVDAYKRNKGRRMVRNIEDTSSIVRDTDETKSTRDVTYTRDNHEHIKDTLRGKKERKVSVKSKKGKPESSKKPKVHPKNRKRLIKSKNSSTNISFENSKHLPQVNPVHHPHKYGNIETFNSPPFVTSHHPCDPQLYTSNNSPNILDTKESSLLCDLCKSIFSEQRQNEAEIANPESSAENLNFPGHKLSGFLRRRRSTGSLFGFRGKRHGSYESIRKKYELGMTMEDLFSNTEINQPLCANELLVPDRARSASISLPSVNVTRRHLEERMFCSREVFPFMTSTKSVPQLHTLAWSRTRSPIFTSESSVYLGSDDECDKMIIPSSPRSMTSSPIFDITSSPVRSRTSSPYRECRSPSAFCDESDACDSLIPTIVLTDCVNTQPI